MTRKLLILAFALPIFFLNPAGAQSKDKEVVRVIMQNQWITKYKKLKTDLENKAAYVKNLEKISDRDLGAIKGSYVETSRMLDAWLDHFVNSIHQNKASSFENLSHGEISQELKDELQTIFTFYANDFSTMYEDITGEEPKVVTNLGESETENSDSDLRISQDANIEMELLIAKVKTPLTPMAWNSIY
jgi:hypothetical protein